MKATFGCFKELYKGNGIYWDGTYNIDGSGSYRTIAEARLAQDAFAIERDKRDAQERTVKAKDGKHIPCKRIGDIVTAFTPDGELTYGIREWRNKALWDLEEKYDMEIVYID